VHSGNALEADLGSVNKIFLYLIERGLSTVLPMLQHAGRALEPRGCRVVTVMYRIKGATPKRVVRVHLKDRPEVMYLLHLYEFDGRGADASTGCADVDSGAAGAESRVDAAEECDEGCSAASVGVGTS